MKRINDHFVVESQEEREKLEKTLVAMGKYFETASTALNFAMELAEEMPAPFQEVLCDIYAGTSLVDMAEIIAGIQSLAHEYKHESQKEIKGEPRKVVLSFTSELVCENTCPFLKQGRTFCDLFRGVLGVNGAIKSQTFRNTMCKDMFSRKYLNGEVA